MRKQNTKQIDNLSEEDEEVQITPQWIIKHKPKSSMVREFFKFNLASIKDYETEKFEDEVINNMNI